MTTRSWQIPFTAVQTLEAGAPEEHALVKSEVDLAEAFTPEKLMVVLLAESVYSGKGLPEKTLTRMFPSAIVVNLVDVLVDGKSTFPKGLSGGMNCGFFTSNTSGNGMQWGRFEKGSTVKMYFRLSESAKHCVGRCDLCGQSTVPAGYDEVPKLSKFSIYATFFGKLHMEELKP